MKFSELNRGLRIHVLVFVVVMLLLTAIDIYTAEPYWVYWIWLGWGIGLAAHAWFVLRGGTTAPTA